MIDILHGLTVTSWAPKPGHASLVFTAKLGRPNGHLNDGFIDEVLCTTNRTTDFSLKQGCLLPDGNIDFAI